MRSWQSPSSVILVPASWVFVPEGGAHGIHARAVIGKRTHQGLIVYREIPCASYDEARAVAAASCAYTVDPTARIEAR